MLRAQKGKTTSINREVKSDKEYVNQVWNREQRGCNCFGWTPAMD